MKNFVVGQTVSNLACIGSDYVNSTGVVEGIGRDWLVVRSSDGEAHFVTGGQLVCLSATEDFSEQHDEEIERQEAQPVKRTPVQEPKFNPEDNHKDFSKFLRQNGLS